MRDESGVEEKKKKKTKQGGRGCKRRRNTGRSGYKHKHCTCAHLARAHHAQGGDTVGGLRRKGG